MGATVIDTCAHVPISQPPSFLLGMVNLSPSPFLQPYHDISLEKGRSSNLCYISRMAGRDKGQGSLGATSTALRTRHNPLLQVPEEVAFA